MEPKTNISRAEDTPQKRENLIRKNRDAGLVVCVSVFSAMLALIGFSATLN
jgi:hypothetical protein